MKNTFKSNPMALGLVGSTGGDFENSLTARPESHISFTRCSHQSHQAYTGVQSCVALDEDICVETLHFKVSPHLNSPS